MVKLFDTNFFIGSILVIAALSVAFLAMTRSELPIVGTGVGALLLYRVVYYVLPLAVAVVLYFA